METLPVLYEDEWLLVVNKTRFIRVQKDASNEPSLEEEAGAYLEAKRKEAGSGKPAFAGLVHRLDQPATGIVLFAKDPETLAALNELMKVRNVKKIYWAVVDAEPPSAEGRLDHRLVFDHGRNKSFVTDRVKKAAKRALLDYRLVGRSERYFFLEIQLITGRHHQIRAQLAAVNCRIKGDLKYGAKRSNPGGGIHLHARSLEFVHPRTGKTVAAAAPPPEGDALWKAFIETSGGAG